MLLLERYESDILKLYIFIKKILYFGGGTFELIACTCAAQRQRTVRSGDVFLLMSLTSQRCHDINYRCDQGILLEKHSVLCLVVR